MTQESFPEIQAAAEALESRLSITQSEIAEMKESIKTKKAFVRTWQKALATISPRPVAQKKSGRKAANAGSQN
jgi:hypothetical protein